MNRYHVYAASGLYMGDELADSEVEALRLARQHHPNVRVRVLKETVQERMLKVQQDDDVVIIPE